MFKLALHSKSFKEISTYVEKMFEQQEDFKLEYFSITDADTLEAVESAEDNKKYRAFIAVYADGDVRLIDNIALN